MCRLPAAEFHTIACDSHTYMRQCNPSSQSMKCEAGRTVEVLVASLNRSLVVLGCVGCEIVLDTEGHVQTKSHNEDVPWRVQVHKLQLGYSNGCDNAEHDAE